MHSSRLSARARGTTRRLRAAPAIAGVVLVVGLVALGMLWGTGDCRQKIPPPEALQCKAFIQTPQFLVWLMLLCGQAAFWALALVPVAGTVRRRYSEAGKPFWHLLFASLAFIAAALALVASRPFFPFGLKSRSHFPDRWPLPHHSDKLAVLSGVAVLVGLLALVGVWLVGIALQRLPEATPPSKEDVAQFLSLRDDFNTLLAIAGAIIGLGTLATGALRNAVLALNPPSPQKPNFEFDTQYVLLYGLFFTGLLAVACAPSFFALRAAGTRLREAAYPLPAPRDKRFAAAVTSRKTFNELLQLNVSASASFKAGVAILAPLVSSLVGLLIPKV